MEALCRPLPSVTIAPLHWVLDTNVVLDLYLFDNPDCRPLREALETGRATCHANGATLDELQRVLAYPQFKLDAERQQDIYRRYRALVRPAAEDVAAPPLPRCGDRDDQKFLELAAIAGADLLISKDKLVLKLARRRTALGTFRIVTPQAALALLVAPLAAA